ncbi:hypothetical protein GCM10010327_19330 [Streptomyces nitrosporeus]|nr:hypothetical protein GCM10010327_19330 [Streptomyces nitrosporeus]
MISAREKIIGLIGGQDPDGGLRRLAEEVADKILADHAHELAERIRTDRCGETSPDAELCPCSAAAADLIDPEVPDA